MTIVVPIRTGPDEVHDHGHERQNHQRMACNKGQGRKQNESDDEEHERRESGHLRRLMPSGWCLELTVRAALGETHLGL